MSEDGSAVAGMPEFGIVWAIKQSFVDYVLGGGGGTATPTGGAWVRSDGASVFAFDADASDRTVGSMVWKFRGEVLFEAHGGMLSMRITDPWIVQQPDSVDVTIVDPFSRNVGDRLTIATARLEVDGLTDAGENWAGVNVTLANAGWALFNGKYEVGCALEPFAVRLPSD
jgi:hypothetical protein